MPKEVLTPSSTFNAKIRDKRLEFTEVDKELISKALSFIWIKTSKKVESCKFERNKVTICCSKGEGFAYFDLVDVENKVHYIYIIILYIFFFLLT
jgi:hypothetical protein